MQQWRAAFLGRRRLPRALSAFELEAFFTFTGAERRAIEQRRTPALQLGLALQLGFLRMCGQPLAAVGAVPPALWRHLGAQFEVTAPDLASLRVMYRRLSTLYEHQELACELLGFRAVSDARRRALVRVLREELARTADRARLLAFTYAWLYERRLIPPRERDLRRLVLLAIKRHEHRLAARIRREVEPLVLADWAATLTRPREDGTTTQTWLWAAPAKHSTRQIDALLARIELLHRLGVDRHLADVLEAILRRYARRLASRRPFAGARIVEPARTLEVACFLRYCLLVTTDQLLLMVQRRVAELWRTAGTGVEAITSDWATLYQELTREVARLAAAPPAAGVVLQGELRRVLAEQRSRQPRSRADRIRDRLIEGVRPVRSLLRALVTLPWAGTDGHPVLAALHVLRVGYDADDMTLASTVALSLGRVWRDVLGGADRARAFAACEVATLVALRRALKNGTVWIEHSLSFRSRERLFIPQEQWNARWPALCRRLGLPQHADAFLEPLLERAAAGVKAVASAATDGRVTVDTALHLTPLGPEPEDPAVAKLRAVLDRRIGEAQLPELLLAVDAEVRYSWLMLGREPRSTSELVMVYAGILAHGTALSAAETARMIPQLSATAIRQAMRFAADERRLAAASRAVLEYMHRHPIAAAWGRSDLASSDMMSLETSRRVWQARIDPRRQTPAVGIYTHVRDRWGISYVQPIVLNERQAGAAIEGVVRDEALATTQLATDTHGHTDVAMALARLLGFDLCPRLKALSDRHLFLPKGSEVPDVVRSIVRTRIDPAKIVAQWDRILHLAASVHAGHASAVEALSRYGSAARGDPLYEALVQLGQLLRTVFLADYFVNDAFRRELLRVLNRGESVNALKRAIYTGRVASFQAKRHDELAAVGDAIGLLANVIMAWNTAQMQVAFDRLNARKSTAVPPELIGRIAPTRTEGINLRGVFRFPVEAYAEKLLPSTPRKTAASAS
jgi:TnpA family transposase